MRNTSSIREPRNMAARRTDDGDWWIGVSPLDTSRYNCCVSDSDALQLWKAHAALWLAEMKRGSLPPFRLNADLGDRILQIKRWNNFDRFFNATMLHASRIMMVLAKVTISPIEPPIYISPGIGHLIVDYCISIGYHSRADVGMLMTFPAIPACVCLYGASGIPPWRWMHGHFPFQWQGRKAVMRGTVPSKKRSLPRKEDCE